MTSAVWLQSRNNPTHTRLSTVDTLVQKTQLTIISAILTHSYNSTAHNNLSSIDSLIQKTYLKHCSKKTKNIESLKVSKPWITSSLRICINKKHQLHKDSLNNPCY